MIVWPGLAERGDQVPWEILAPDVTLLQLMHAFLLGAVVLRRAGETRRYRAKSAGKIPDGRRVDAGAVLAYDHAVGVKGDRCEPENPVAERCRVEC